MRREYLTISTAGEDGKRHRVYRFFCYHQGCGGSVDINVNNQTGTLPPEAIERKAAQLGWLLAKRSDNDECPRCYMKRKGSVLRAVPVPAASDPRPIKGVASAGLASTANAGVPPMAEAEMPDPMVQTETAAVLITLKLGEVYDAAASCYRAGWSDERIAVDLNVPAKQVRRYREVAYGPSAAEQREVLATELKAGLDDMKATYKSLVAAHARFREDADRQAAKLKESLDKYEALLHSYDASFRALLDRLEQLDNKGNAA